MWLRLKWVVVWSLWATRLVRQPTLPVRVSGGALRGNVAHDGSHRQYLAIPYATVNRSHRFREAGPEPTWDGVFEAINENVRCPHKYESTQYMLGQEDCLVLNVFTPINAATESNFPVMVYFHGGGFYDGSGSRFFYGPNYLVPKGVILVTVNYRLNILGFLCLRIKEAPGNAGMKDQVAALKWVKRNIMAFGGDPDNVTIFGGSAGAASVSFHIVSPMSKGLFHKAIAQSGSSLAAWAFQYRPIYKAGLLAAVMGFNSEDPRELYNFLMNKSDAELIRTRVPRKEGNVVISELLYTPCIEKKIEGEEPFLTDLPYNYLARGDFNKVPLITGSNVEEGFLFADKENDTTLPKIDYEKSLPKDLVFPTDRERKEAAEKLKGFYTGLQPINEDMILKLSKMHGEPYFVYPSLAETDLMLKTTDKPIYTYFFSYNGWKNIPKWTLKQHFRKAPGATHADELFYLFKLLPVPKLFENQMINKMTTMWTNFAKYGDPTPVKSELLPVKWHPIQKSSPQALLIDKDFSTAPFWPTESLKYWHELYTKYRRLS